jgi:hypothetical protein
LMVIVVFSPWRFTATINTIYGTTTVQATL